MTPEQIDLVRSSFDALWPFRRKLADQFYGRFFELAPDTRRLFPNDMERQQLKLMDTLAAIVATLDQREICQSIISHTGRKHADFGVQTSHFTAFGEAPTSDIYTLSLHGCSSKAAIAQNHVSFHCR